MLATHEERRRYIRFKPSAYSVSVCEEILAEIIDISKGGVLCSCLTDISKICEINELCLLDCENGSSVDNLKCRLVRTNTEIKGEEQIFTFSLEFKKITSNQRSDIEKFIKTARANM